MKKFNSIILAFLLTAIFVAATIAVSYSWTNQRFLYNQSVVGKTKVSAIIWRYFNDGSGTSEDPYQISEPQHFFNLAYLQDLGYFDTQTFFELKNDIDFVNAPAQYSSMPPIGTDDHPFVSVFDGNFYTISNYHVNGTWFDGTTVQKLQDIGTFGYIGNGGIVSNFFLKNMTITSDGVVNDLTGYHPHNDGITNFAIGYAVGHLADGSSIENVFVVNPTISSAAVTISSRTQYGLIGFSDLDEGTLAGSPEDVAYNFNLNADSMYPAVQSAVSTYGTELVNNSAIDTIADVLELSTSPSKRLVIGGETQGFDVNYTFSTLQIYSDTISDWVYFYDQMVTDSNPIGDEVNGYYSRKNIDLIGDITFVSNAALSGYTYTFAISDQSASYVTPTVGNIFDRTIYPESVMLYVKATNDLNNLGSISAVYSSTGDMTYNVGTTSGSATSATNFSDSGVESVMSINDALCMVTYNATTDVMTIVDSEPDFYVFNLGVTNGIVKIGEISFNYTPQAVDKAALSTIGLVDYIDEDEMTALKTEWITYQTITHYFTYLNFGFEIDTGQAIDINTDKTYTSTDDAIDPNEFTFTFDQINTNSGIITVYILNLPNDSDTYNNIVIYYGTTYIGTYNTDIAEVTFDASNAITVTPKSLE
ncbi:MAG: hypothetical protein KAU02_03405 [Tenericutes bacterium]|nr:hypothetical protein [Mycoplasmatota bacterium]